MTFVVGCAVACWLWTLGHTGAAFIMAFVGYIAWMADT